MIKTWAITAVVAYVFLCFVGITAPAHEDVTTQQAKDMIDGNDPPFLLDVRELSEYCDEIGGHIPGAYLYQWNTGVLQERYEELPPERRILVICRSGNRSHHAANFLEDNGFPYVYDMLGGMNAWQFERTICIDSDGDGTNDDLDNCTGTYNPEQVDSDEDGTGNLCDDDCPLLDGTDPVDFADFAILMQQWMFTGPGLVGDLDYDDDVDPNDLAILTVYWLSPCQP